MPMPRPNILILFSDEHRRDAAGCYGHGLVRTPNLDRLAAGGTRFTRAYTPSPICVPARAALATGQYVHNTRCWSNAQAYHGNPPSFGHLLQANGLPVESIGKLHYRGGDTNNGFDRERLPLYIKDGIGWVKGLLRNHEAVLDCSHYAQEIGPGSDRYTDYDLGVTREACRWIGDAPNGSNEKPWTLFVSWLRPHYPLTCPPEFYRMYPLEQMDEARFTVDHELPSHPVVEILRRNFNYDDYFDDRSRQVARASYYGLCSFLDHQVGQVLQALEDSGQADNTLVIYTSDHGDHNGDRRMWTKMSMYEESAGIPMILRGPGVPRGVTCDTPASLVDVFPTVSGELGLDIPDSVHRPLPGRSLVELAHHPEQERAVLSEYHDGGSPTGMFMLRWGRWKYNVYPGYDPELYDLGADPGELHDLGTDPAHADTRADCQRQLEQLVNPAAANTRAFDDQAALIERLGGADAILASEEYDFTPVPN